MKTLILAAIRCSLFTAVAVFALAHPVKANLITNGGFETGDFTGWTVSGSASVVGGQPHSGAFQAASFVNSVILTQNVTTTPGASYVVDFWFAHGGALVFGVSWDGSGIFGEVFGGGFSDYTEHTFTLTASSTTTELLFFSSILEGGVLLDDISVTRAGVPDGGSTVSLLGCALLGLAAVRRKLSC